MEQLILPAGLLAFATQITSIFRFLQGREWGRATTAVIPWVGAFVALGLGAAADATSALVLPGFDTPLGDMDVASLLYVAVLTGTGAGLTHKALVSVDSTQTAAEPPVGPPSS